MSDEIVIDAEDKILGRLATRVAREAKDGKEVRVINSEKAVISGSREEIEDEYRQKHQRGTRHDGPYFPKAPDRILKRTVRGMLAYKTQEGKEAFERVKTYLGEPADLEPGEVDIKEGDELRYKNYVKLGDISRSIGWTPKVEIE